MSSVREMNAGKHSPHSESGGRTQENLLRKGVIFHPFVIAIYPVIALFNRNVDQVEPGDILRTLVVSLLAAMLVFAFMYLLTRSIGRAAILSSSIIMLFYSYGHVYSIIEDVQLLGINVGRHRVLLAIWLLIFVLAVVWVRKKARQLKTVNRAFNIFSIVIVAIPLFQITGHQVRSMQDQAILPLTGDLREAGVETDILQLQESVVESPPDIYFIILDMYARADILASDFDFNNSTFLDFLVDQGFTIASCSQSNYGNTMLSLAATLNLDYFQTLVDQEAMHQASPYSFGRMVQNNRLRAALEEIGYSIVALESGFPATDWKDAQRYLSPGSSLRVRAFGGLNPFEAMLLRSSLGIFLFEFQDRLSYAVRANLQDYAYIQHRERILFALDELEHIAQLPGPKFVFAHILAPHNPFVIGPDGEFVPRESPFTLNADPESNTWDEFIPGYLGEVEYLNARFKEIIPRILEQSERDPIIVLQGDHGVLRLPDAADRLAILNALYLPGDVGPAPYSSISPVNTFRLILDRIFGTELGLLEDISYYPANREAPMEFERIPYDVVSCDGP